MTSIETLYQHFLEHPIICTDSRKIAPNSLFFALKGENFDGNLYAEQAILDGAAFAVVDHPSLAGKPNMLLVPNTLTALQQLAHHYRRTMQIPIIGIGGSNGKTTTKELVSAILCSHYSCHFTKGNFNNHIGVPLTLLAMPADTEVAVIEMGANHPGEIEELCRIAAPTHGLITNIGKEHLEGFGSLEGVKKAEGELFRYLAKNGGCAFVNESEKYLKSMARNNKRKVTYAAADALHDLQETIVEVQLLRQTPFVEVAFLGEQSKPVQIQSKLFGRHNFHNIMSGIALGMYFKVPAAKIKAALEAYTPQNNRSQIVIKDNNTIILDAYNANPSSMEAALESFEVMESAHKIAILGDMLELGAESTKEHIAILRKAQKMNFQTLITVGSEFATINPAQYGAIHFANAAAARIWLETQPLDGALMLVKGSRGIKLETIFA